MKKGDLRKKEIIQTAETLFCQRGYEQTSIQDILDQLKTSKGSFYHHFISKDALLVAICSKRAEQNLESALSISGEKLNASQKLDRLLTGMIPLHDKQLSFILMLLPIFTLPEGKTFKSSYCDSLENAFHSSISDVISEGIKSGEMFCTDPDLYAQMVILLTNRLWISICEIIVENETAQKETDLNELLYITDQYRSAVERMLSISYGSVIIISIPMLKGIIDQIHVHWNTKA